MIVEAEKDVTITIILSLLPCEILWIKFIVEEKYLCLTSLEVFKRIIMTLIKNENNVVISSDS